MSVSAPDVSIVLAVYNDIRNLPRALRSLSRQTLAAIEFIVVDDCSTDGSYEMALRLAETDSRFRVARTERNSGGCASPRNLGLAVARGHWILFCDSDDELEIHAAKNLLLAAERVGAELSVGVCELHEERTGRTQRVNDIAHHPGALGSVAERTQLLYENSSTGALYQRELLTRLHLEFNPILTAADFEFATRALVGARGVAVIGETAYLRHVERIGEEMTTSRRRWLVRNVADRLVANRHIDAVIAQNPDSHLRHAATLRFFNEDLATYLAVILDSDATTAGAIAEYFRDYLSSLELDPAADLPPLLRVALYHLLIDDLDGVRRAMRFTRWAASVDGTVHIRDGRELWVCDNDHDIGDVGGQTPDWWLDVSLQGLARVPLTQRRYCHQFTGLIDNRLRGSTSDYLDSLSEISAARVVLLNEGRVVAAAPVIFEQVTPLHWEWSTTDRIKPVGKLRLGDKGFLALELTINSVMNTSVARASEVRRGTTASARISPWRREGLHLESRTQGIVGWRIIRRSAFSLGAAGIRKAWSRLPGTRALAGRWQHLLHETGPKVARRLGEYFPDGTAYVISSDHGRQFTGHPRAIAEYLAEFEDGARLRWLGSPSAAGLPDWITWVDPQSIRGAWRIARARSWIDDFGIDTRVRKSRHTKYLQTWHGIALKRVGSDVPDWPLLSPRARRPRPSNRERWDALLAPSEFFAETTARAIGYCGELIDNCSPFGEAVMRAGSDSLLRTRLDLPVDRPVILYAPTGRAELDESAQLDLADWWRTFGNTAYLLVRSHPNNPLVVPAKWSNGIRDISGEADLAAFLGAADAFLTDYSALVFDFARLGRPIGLYAPDFELFTRRSVGLYVDPEIDGPGPVLRSQQALAEWVNFLVAAHTDGVAPEHQPDVAAFASSYAGLLDDTSAARATAALKERR